MHVRKGLPVAVLCLFAFAFLGAAYAQESPSEWSKSAFQNKLAAAKEIRFSGKVVSHDPLCHCVVVKTAQGLLTLQDDYAVFMQEYNEAKGLKIGAKVRGVYKTVDYINYMMSISYASNTQDSPQ